MRRKQFIKLVYLLIVLALLLAWRPFIHHLNRNSVFVRNKQSVDDLIRPHGPTAQFGYIVTLKFTGQQVAGIRGILSQQCWLKQFNIPMSIVEPFVSDATLSHSKRLWDSEETGIASKPHFSRFYQASKVANDLEMTGWKTFLKNAPRKLIVLTIENSLVPRCLTFTKRSCNRKRPIPEKMGCGQSPELSHAVKYLQAKGFQVVGRVCLNCSYGELREVAPADLTEFIFQGHKSNDVTLLINRWKFSFKITPDCVSDCDKKLDDVFLRPEIARDAHKHLELLKVKLGYEGKNTRSLIVVAFMLRLEWFMISKTSRTLEELTLCFSTIQTTIESIADKSGKEVLLTLALDIGRFGSGTFSTTIERHKFSHQNMTAIEEKVKGFVSQLYNKRMNFQQWEETFDNIGEGSPERGYIAALQAQEVESADCLILMGGGHFQMFTREQFIKRNPTNKCIHNICVPNAFD